MGLFRPLINKGAEIAPSDTVLSDRLITPANAMTAARPILALKAARMLIHGGKPVTPWIAGMALSDAEGNVARLIDKIAPNSGLGTSVQGAEYDPIADTVAMLIVSGAALGAPRMPTLGRAAIATSLGHEGLKAAWALNKNKEYQQLTGARLMIKPTIAGKESMAEKFSAVGLAVLASDLENHFARGALSAAAMAMAATGTIRAETERQVYDLIADDMIDQAEKL